MTAVNGSPAPAEPVRDQETSQRERADPRERADSKPSGSSLHVGALALGAASTLIVALRLLSVARLNPQTADGILQASGTANVIIGTVISLIPSIALIAGACLALNETFRRSDKPGLLGEFVIWASIIALIVIAILTIPYRYVYAPAAVFVILVLARLLKEPIAKLADVGDGRVGRILVRVSGGLVALLLIFGVAISQPWMPAERLTLNNHQQVTGYILNQTPGSIAVLGIRTREITYYGANALVRQSICSNVPPNDFPIIYYIHLPILKNLNLSLYKHC
jgi:hypothetical protein